MKHLLALLLTLVFCKSGAQTITTVAGCHISGYAGDGGVATLARLNNPGHIVFNRWGDLLFADYRNHRVRKVNSSGIISTVAGIGSAGYFGDGGAATLCKLNLPNGISIDALDNIYIADQGNSVIRKLDTFGIITTIAGNGIAGYSGDGGAATNARFNQCTGTFIDNTGNIYVADYFNSRIRKIDISGIVTTIAGTGVSGYSGDGGAATLAKINIPGCLTSDALGNLFFNDQYNHRVRKIDPSGIITTVAGTGTLGYSGDGGQATAADLYYPAEIKTDESGNLFIDDSYNNVIRMVNNAGVISTVVGTGMSGYSGDGGAATAATLNQPWGITFNESGDLFIGDAFNHVIRKVNFAPAFVADSFKIYIDKYCSGPQIRVAPNHVVSGMYLKTYFGDGGTDSSVFLGSGSASFSHVYANSGTYTVKQVLYTGSTIVDSFSFSYSHALCNDFQIKFYYDGNGNCIKDATDIASTQPILLEVDSNGIAIDTISTTSGLYYTAYGSTGCIYGFKVLAAPSGFHVTCPSGGVLYDTISVTSFSHAAKYIGLSCITSTSYDLSLRAIAIATGVIDQYGEIYVQNAYCLPQNATVTLHYSAKYGGSPRNIRPTPTSISGNTIVWNLSSLSSTLSRPVTLYYSVWYSSTYLTIGDTVHSYYKVTPDSGDDDTSNNDQMIIDTVRAGCDPNAMQVTPVCLPSGPGATQLQYTIHFENTGNDTAHNIYVMDTLSDNVDVSSMRILMSSHEMYVSKLKDATNHNILKFDFPKINLLDSSHHFECDGAIIFNINTKPGLTDASDIYNRAGIYFDINDVVMTNQVANVVGCLPSGVSTIQNGNKIDIYPNPASNELTVTSTDKIDGVVICDPVGQTRFSQSYNAEKVRIDIAELPAGIYLIRINGTEVRKFVKQ